MVWKRFGTLYGNTEVLNTVCLRGPTVLAVISIEKTSNITNEYVFSDLLFLNLNIYVNY